MRSRSNSAVRLDYYSRIVIKSILKFQDPVTGLLPGSNESDHAWVRDNVYSIMAVWALSLAYKKTADLDEDRAKGYELEQATVKCMRGLLTAMLGQKEKVERFKETFSKSDAIHAKFSAVTGHPVVGDHEWGHLQIDAVSLYLLVLAQMTASGIQIIFTLDEVAFVQNMVFYIESAYSIPDYGIWERGDKTNTGITELNSSSIGMAKAALEAMNELDLFGARGGPASVIHVMADETQKCQAVLESMLPRESLSKETDAALLTVVGFPAFAVENQETIDKTVVKILSKLGGEYGCKRFLRDGYRTPKEDPRRLHYEPWELRFFDGIECEWPLFFCFLIFYNHFKGDKENAKKYSDKLDSVMLNTGDGLKCVPELYAVPPEAVQEEYLNPGSQARVPAGRAPMMWAQSMFVISRLLLEGYVASGEIDPMNRRLTSSVKKPDVVVQVVVLAKDKRIQELFAAHDYQIKTVDEVDPIEIHPARVLSHLYTYLGRNNKLGLTGRRNRDMGILATSKLYQIQDRIFAFTPQRFDFSRNYMDCDLFLMMTTLEYGLQYLSTCWSALGRPTITLIMGDNMLDEGEIPPVIMQTMKKLKNGYVNGARVSLGNLAQFKNTSCVTNLNFLGAEEDGEPGRINPEIEGYLSRQAGHKTPITNKSTWLAHGRRASDETSPSARVTEYKRRMSLRGSIRRSRSIRMPSNESSANGALRNDETIEDALGPEIRIERHFDRQDTLDDSEAAAHEYAEFSIAIAKSKQEINYTSSSDIEELLQMLEEAQSMEDQGDILHFLAVSQGLDYRLTLNEKDVTVRELLSNLYETSCLQKVWGLVRHSAGFLGKRVDDLSKAVTDLIVRGKQVTVGAPPDNEAIITAPMTSKELRKIIHESYGADMSMAMLTQELLVYLAMFITTEPQLFHGMLRLRVGLIIQVMASELGRSLHLEEEDANDQLINLSPYEMRNLLHHIMSGSEFGIRKGRSGGYSVISDNSMKHTRRRTSLGGEDGGLSSRRKGAGSMKSWASGSTKGGQSIIMLEEEDAIAASEDQGSWLRRRRLDGALNRVPHGFYAKVWTVLERCHKLCIQERYLELALTQEMTSEELKFALCVESVLNTIPIPEFRQLMVEAIAMLAQVVEHNVVPFLGQVILLDDLVYTANRIFLIDQSKLQGDATLCCAVNAEGDPPYDATGHLKCHGPGGICRHFYESAPSGMYGTMPYFVRALCQTLETIPKQGEIDCNMM